MNLRNDLSDSAERQTVAIACIDIDAIVLVLIYCRKLKVFFFSLSISYI